MRQNLINALFLIACAMVIVGGGLLSADREDIQFLLSGASTQESATAE